MTKKKRKRNVKRKIKFIFAFVVFGIVIATLGYNLYSNVMNIKEMKIEKKNLQDKIVELASEKEILENDILKLKDPDYIAKYVREHYYYSKDGELILRMDN